MSGEKCERKSENKDTLNQFIYYIDGKPTGLEDSGHSNIMPGMKNSSSLSSSTSSLESPRSSPPSSPSSPGLLQSLFGFRLGHPRTRTVSESQASASNVKVDLSPWLMDGDNAKNLQVCPNNKLLSYII